MSASPPAHQPQHTTVFNALGSYADRIKENKGSPSNSTPNGVVTKAHTPPALKAPTSQPEPAQPAEDGPWEMVQTGRHKSRLERQDDRRHGPSGSRSWRERQNSKENEEVGPAPIMSKKDSSASAPPGPVAEKAPPSRATTSGIGSKSVWGTPLVHPQASSAGVTPISAPATSILPSRSAPVPQSHTAPSSPSLNGTTVTNNSTSVTSPDLSVDAASSTAGAPSAVEEMNEQATVLPPAAANPWDERKKKLGPTTTTTEPAKIPVIENSSRGPVLQFGSVSPPLPDSVVMPTKPGNGVKIGNQRRRSASATMSVAPVDAVAWPDVAEAAEVTKVTDEKKDKVKEERQNSETSTAVDEPPSSRKEKPKWTAIPATELLAAADQAAEKSRKEAAAQRRAAKAARSPESRGKPRKSTSVDGRRGRASFSAVRLPPMPSSKTTETAFKPSFGTASSRTTETESSVGAEHVSVSAPLSRQNSRVSRPRSPRLSRTQASSPTSHALGLDTTSMRLGPGPVKSAPSGASSAPMPNQPFIPNGPTHPLPRPPRGRVDRSSFSRGGAPGPRGFRSPSSHRPSRPFTSPTQTMNGLPPDNLYSRGYGMGYGYFPQPMGGVAYDSTYSGWPVQQGFYGQTGMPPPPMPQTIIPGLDGLRVYVLGQVEYYFSMQNLAMDFFLRQQMDTEGWIEIAMIASFNRVRTLTTDLSIIKEVMELSAILEVRDDKVRLSGGAAKQWVLPDARPSTLPDDSEYQADSNTNMDLAMSMSALGVEDSSFRGSTQMNGVAPGSVPSYSPGGVENALMKTVPTSSDTSVMNGDESRSRTTPGTSISGDREDEGLKEQ